MPHPMPPKGVGFPDPLSGTLNYRPERVLEAYYAYGLDKRTALTFDYQFIVNPGYNADRGPVSIYALRFHSEF